METKFITGTVKSVGKEGDDFDVEVVCSDECIDRSDETIQQSGWQLAEFLKNPVFLAAHQHRLDNGRSTVVGSFRSAGVEGGNAPALVGKVKFADTELGREYRTLYKDGHMRAVSVGFRSLKGEWRTVNNAAGKGQKVYVHTQSDLIEVSAVAVGCNQNALARLRTMGLDASGETDVRAIVREEIAQVKNEILDAVEDGFDAMKAILPDYFKTEAASPGAAGPCADEPLPSAGEDQAGKRLLADALKGLSAAVDRIRQ